MNTVSIRILGATTSKTINQLSHDLRVKKVNYLKSEKQKNLFILENKNIIFSQKETDPILFNKLKEKINVSAKEQKEIHEKAIRQKSQIRNYFINGIITFSTDMKKDFFLQQKKFKELAKKTLDDICKKYGIKLLHFTIHLDEKTPHIHFTFENVNRTTGRSVQRYITKSDLRVMQTETAKHWEEMGYKRGEENSKSKHYSVSIGHQKEELENLKREIQRRKKEVKAQDIESSHKKLELDKLDDILKETRIKIKEVKNCAVLNEKFNEDIDTLIKKSKKMFLLNEEQLRTNLKETLQAYSESRFINQTEKKALEQVELLEQEKDEIIDNYDELVEDYNQIFEEKSALLTSLNAMEEEMEMFKEQSKRLETQVSVEKNTINEIFEDIKELEKEYDFSYKEFKKNLKKRNKQEIRYKNR